MMLPYVPSMGMFRKRPFIPMCVFIITLMFVMLTSTPPSGPSSGRLNAFKGINNVVELPTLLRDLSPDPKENNIYQIVTNHPSVILTRQFCSLESYCRQNPGSVVWFLLVEAPSLQGEPLLWLQLLQDTYSNLRVANLEINITVEHTPVESIISSGALQTSIFPLNHMSDVLRLALVSKFGGLYTDFDFICLRSVEHIKNTMALALINRVMNGFFHFDAGHPLLQLFMENNAQNFRGDDWGFNGPYLFSRTSKQNCPKFEFLVDVFTIEYDAAADNLVISIVKAFDWGGGADGEQDKTAIQHSVPHITETIEGPCHNVTLLVDILAVMPVNVSTIEQIFDRNSVGLLDEARNRSYGVHLFNRHTKTLLVERGAATAAEDLFSTNCPIVYSEAVLRNISL